MVNIRGRFPSQAQHQQVAQRLRLSKVASTLQRGNVRAPRATCTEIPWLQDQRPGASDRVQLFHVRALPPKGRGGGGARQEGATGPAFSAPMAPRAPRPDADVSFPSHYTSRHHCLRLPRKSRPVVRPSPQISSFSASWSFPPVLGPRGGASRTECLLA